MRSRIHVDADGVDAVFNDAGERFVEARRFHIVLILADAYGFRIYFDKFRTYYAATTKAIQLAAGDYYIAVQSTNAKKGGAAYYNVEVSFDAYGIASALSQPADALADASAAVALGQDDGFLRQTSGLLA